MDKLLDILKSAGFPYAYDHFAEGEAPDPPFLCYLPRFGAKGTGVSSAPMRITGASR